MKSQWDVHLASEVYVYGDDGRATEFCPEICWAAASHFAAVCSNKGVQDAKRKRTSPSWTPGPWAGNITLNDRELVVIVSKAKWDKTRCLINELWDMIDTAVSAPDQTSEEAKIPLQRLLEIRGFLIYVVRTYPCMSPYLKGLHNTIDGWQEDIDEGGWKLSGKARKAWEHARAVLPCRRVHAHSSRRP